ncbi:MAG: (2Fe-2S)-binding protein [Methyloglobulus sp.]|nr:(2Fe-2S)-binding protein [Methyloglobulus sp.]
MYVCVCKAVTDTQIKRAIDEGMCSRRELFKCLGVGGDCGKCNLQVKELLLGHNQNQTLMQNSANPSILAA